MEEESTVKAPVTRLRRRLSVEAEDVSSPQTPSTPKKRSARLAAKPLLDNIDENAPIPSPKPTRGRKSLSRDLTEPEEKVVTPSRRTIRTRSNTSLTSETLLAVDSPRAKRAARRNSNVGSDTEGPLTPVPQTRKTRKNSEGAEQLPEHIPTKKAIIFTEKPQTKRKSKEFQKSPPTVAEKKELQNTPPDLPAEVVAKPAYQLTSETLIFAEEPQVQKPQAKRKSKELHKTPEINQDAPELHESPQNVPEKKELQKSPQTAKLEKSRQNAGLEKSPQKAELQKSPQKAELQNSTSTIENLAEVVKEPPIQLIKTAIAEEAAVKINSKEMLETPQKDAEQIVLQNTPHNATEKIELKNPYAIDENEDVKNSITVYINEDQANMDKLIQLSQETGNKAGSEDQCVPVVNRLEMPTGIINDLTSVNFNPLSKPKEKRESISSLKGVEPMDIDESIPRDISITDYSKENLSEVEKQVEFEKPNKSKLSKSSSDVSERVNTNKEKAGNENKSTLILSLVNDESIAETNLEKSPVIPIKETLENLSNFSDVGKNRDSKKTNLSHITENKDTPLKHKNSNIIGMKTSTPVISTKHGIMVEKSVKHTSKNTSTKNIVASRKSNKSDSYLNDESSDEEKMDKLVMDEAVEKSVRHTSKNTSTKNISVASRKSSKSDSYLNDESSDEEKMDKLVMDEAEDSGPDYESGDSRDESEIRYERENEILEQGETLNTDSFEEDGSDDEDYEIDSFVVSSDLEDDDLLSGTGDDLSISDKELTMAAKSKKKFNDRKLKEQKKASKEMYAARHNKKTPLNISSDTDASKPLRFVSDDSNDGTKEIKPRKKKNRMRLDSFHELSAINSDADMPVSRNANESKQILDNNFNSRVLNEHEITAVINESINQKTDPLKNTIKAEPMTPQKSLDISTVNISVRQDVEEVQVTENASMLHANETSDPLQATMAFNDDGEPSSSGNEEIIQNYDSMLSELNEKSYKNKVKDHDISLNLYREVKVNNPIEDQLNLTKTKEHKRKKTIESQVKNKSSNKMEVDSTDPSLPDYFDSTLAKDKKRNKTHNISLNPSKKSKSSEKEPIVDQLNLTNTKERNRRTTDQNQNNSNKASIQTEADVTDDTSSDSLDLKLLFPDDESDTSEDKKNKSRGSNTDNFIPLKQTEGKTDHTESKDDVAISVAYQSVTETSSSKKKNKRLSELQNIGQIDGVTATEKNSSGKKKSKKETLSVTDSATETTENELNVSKEKKNKKSQDSFTVTDSSEIKTTKTEHSVSKKNNKKSKESHIVTDSTDDNLDVCIGSTKKNKRKESLTLRETENTEDEGNNSVSSSKNKNRKAAESLTETEMIENEMNLSIAFNRKKHRKASESLPVAVATEIDNQSNIVLAETPGITKKKLSESQSVDEPETKELTEKTENAINTSLVSNKKKNRKTLESLTIPDPSDNASEKPSNTSFPLENARKKNKNNLSVSLPTSQLYSENTLENITNSSKKKHKHSESSEANNENDLEESVDDAPEEASSKKRKRKSSFAETQDGPQVSSKLENDSLVAAGGRKKKLKLCAEIENDLKTGEVKAESSNTDKAMDDSSVVENKRKKNKKSKLNDEACALENESAAAGRPVSVADTLEKKEKTQTETTDQDRAKNIPDKRRCKKRKDREDDEGHKQTKVLKENFFDNIQISRLPNAFLEQIENPKPKQPKHKKIVSTSAFIVEETVKVKDKPSHYLEESIYLNSDSPEKRRKNKIEKPKVLPFVPTASTSGRGFTTNFQVKVCPHEFKFIAQSSETVNFKNDYIQSQKLKKLGTYKMYKDQRKVKLSKF